MAASASGGRDWYAALPLPWRTDSLDYVLRSIGAAALALGLGLYLQLDSPFSAASTVLLLINPVQGAVVGKGWWRAVGTLVGTLAAFVLTALFAQKMLLFVVALGFWLGLCVGVMSLVRHFYATAAVVAGYTVCLALGSAMVEPEADYRRGGLRAHRHPRLGGNRRGLLPEPGDRALQPQDRVRAGAPASRLALRGDAGAGRCAACRCG